jgi:hypothetical protein
VKCRTVLDIETAVPIDEARRRIDRLLDKLTDDPRKVEKLLTLIEE